MNGHCYQLHGGVMMAVHAGAHVDDGQKRRQRLLLGQLEPLQQVRWAWGGARALSAARGLNFQGLNTRPAGTWVAATRNL
jgi:hypothetical protein